MPKMILRITGSVTEDAAGEITTILEECYERLEPHSVEILDLLLFEDSVRMNAFYAREREASGIVSQSLGEEFFAVHDAWSGTPRIGVCIERMRRLPRLVQIGALRHEVGHSVLHGSIEHYVFSVTPPLLEASKRFSLTRDYLFPLLYLISIAVKDFEVSRLLVEKGYVEDQVAYSRHVLTTSRDDLEAWRMARGNPAAMALCAASRLKDAAPTAAIGQVLKEPAVETVREEISYFDHPVAGHFLNLVEALPQNVAGDTLSNVNAIVRLFVERLLEPVFADFSR